MIINEVILPRLLRVQRNICYLLFIFFVRKSDISLIEKKQIRLPLTFEIIRQPSICVVYEYFSMCFYPWYTNYVPLESSATILYHMYWIYAQYHLQPIRKSEWWRLLQIMQYICNVCAYICNTFFFLSLWQLKAINIEWININTYLTISYKYIYIYIVVF